MNRTPKLKPNIKLPEALPKTYPPNFATLPPEARQAIEEDRARHYVALRWWSELRRWQIEKNLQTLPRDLETDMRRRLNIAKKNIKALYNPPKGV